MIPFYSLYSVGLV